MRRLSIVLVRSVFLIEVLALYFNGIDAFIVVRFTLNSHHFSAFPVKKMMVNQFNLRPGVRRNFKMSLFLKNKQKSERIC